MALPFGQRFKQSVRTFSVEVRHIKIPPFGGGGDSGISMDIEVSRFRVFETTRLLLIAVFFLIFLSGCNEDKESYDPRAMKLKIVVAIEGRTFEFPAEYAVSDIDTKSARVVHATMALQARLPIYSKEGSELQPLEENYDLASQRKGGLYIAGASSKASFEDYLNSKRRGVGRFEKIGKHWDLDGMNLYLPDGKSEYLYSSIFTSYDEYGRLEVLIECSEPERSQFIKYPGCDMVFINDGVWHDVHFSKSEYLRYWRNIQNSVIQFLLTHEVELTK